MNSDYPQSSSPETRLENARLETVRYARRALQSGLGVAFPQLAQHLAGRQILHEQLSTPAVIEESLRVSDSKVSATAIITTPAETVASYNHQQLIRDAQQAVANANRSDYGLSA